MRAYIAGAWSRRTELSALIPEFERMGFQIRSSWLTNEPDASYDDDQDRWKDFAKRDMQEMEWSNVVFVFTGTLSRGGHYFEMGYAAGRHLHVVLIGPAQNVFTKAYPRYDTFENFCEEWATWASSRHYYWHYPSKSIVSAQLIDDLWHVQESDAEYLRTAEIMWLKCNYFIETPWKAHTGRECD